MTARLSARSLIDEGSLRAIRSRWSSWQPQVGVAAPLAGPIQTPGGLLLADAVSRCTIAFSLAFQACVLALIDPGPAGADLVGRATPGVRPRGADAGALADLEAAIGTASVVDDTLIGALVLIGVGARPRTLVITTAGPEKEAGHQSRDND